jgi:hypothetical protein
MSYFVIDNFKYGLDSRRSELTTLPGTLSKLENGHINQGAEIEKRLAFYKVAMPTNCFGAEWLGNKLLVFGNVDVGALTIPLPATLGLTYQQLKHPAVLAGEAVIADYAMTEAVHSPTFDNKAFVIAKYFDGRSFVYYNGVLVGDFVHGLILPYLSTNAKIATNIAMVVNLLTTLTGYVATVVDGTKVNIVGKAGVDFDLVAALQLIGGSTGTLTVDAGYPTSDTGRLLTVSPTGRFRVMAGTASPGVNQVSSVKVNGVTVTTAAVNWATSNTETAKAVAAVVATGGYTATSDRDFVVLKRSSGGSSANNHVVQANTAGNVCVGLCQLVFTSVSFDLNQISADGVGLLTGVPLSFVGGGASKLSDFLVTVATNINAGTIAGAVHGFLACAIGTQLFISRASTSSSDSDVTTEVDSTPSGVAIDLSEDVEPSGSFVVTVEPEAITGSFQRNSSDATRTEDDVEVTPNPLNRPYTYLWQALVGYPQNQFSDPDRVRAMSPRNRATKFEVQWSGVAESSRFGIPHYSEWVCIVQDKEGHIKHSPKVVVIINCQERRDL